jgi:hypothetical protein
MKDLNKKEATSWTLGPPRGRLPKKGRVVYYGKWKAITQAIGLYYIREEIVLLHLRDNLNLLLMRDSFTPFQR